jgi:hypothetical protein
MTATVLDFLDDPELLGEHYAGASWNTWRCVLKAAFALPMTAAERRRFQEVAGGRAPPGKPVRELVCAVGRGGGKDAVAAALATWIATTCDTSRLRAGEYADVLCFATDREQAGIAFSYIRELFEDVPLLRGMILERNRRLAISENVITLTNKARITVATNNRRSPRGKTIAAAIYDEAAHWFNEHYANPDVETDTAVSPGLARFGGSLKILISSVNRRAGLLYERYSRYFGKDDPDTLVVSGTSLDFNPTLDPKIIEAELERDPERAGAEYLSKWRDDLSLFVDRALIEAAVDPGCLVRPLEAHRRYVAFADASSGRADSFALAVAHRSSEGQYILDHLWEKPSPFNVETAVSEAAGILRSYRLDRVVGDKYAVGFVESAFKRNGVSYQESERDKSALYLEALPLFTTGKVRLIDNKKLIRQFVSLERRTSVLGRDTVSHPDHKNAHDDLANSVAGALTLLSVGAQPVFVSDEALFRARNYQRMPAATPFSAAAYGRMRSFWTSGSEL